jgi:2-phosphosulfolactate phosphatase
MEIKILNLIDGSKKAEGLTVIIDVFRAFSVACYAFEAGVKKIIPVGDIDIAYKLKKENPDFLLIGERRGKKLEGFDYGNSPAEFEGVDLAGKTIVQTTSSGTQGIANATGAGEIITGSFVNAQAIINYIKKQNPEKVSLVAMGSLGSTITKDDVLFAEYIKNALEGKPNNFSTMVNEIRKCPSGAKFFNPDMDWAPEKDFDMCLALDKFNFVLKVDQEDGQVFLKKV